MRYKAALLATVLLSTPSPAAGDPISNAHLKTPRAACHLQEPLDCVQLPPGYFLDEATHAKLDSEVKRLQDQETRLQAENVSLRQSAQSWTPGWVSLTVSFAVGALASAIVIRAL